MKKKTLTNILVKIIVILTIILLSLISFLGIHKTNLNGWKNILPEYTLSKELSNIRTFVFAIDDSTEEVEVEKEEETTSDATSEDTAESTDATDETITDETQATEEPTEESAEDTTTAEEPETKEVPVNDPSVLTTDNYNKSKKIIEERLKKFGITDADISVNEKTGELSISVPYDNVTDYTVSLAINKGELSIIDTDTKEVLISKNMIKNISVNYQQADTNTDTDSEYASYDIGIVLEFTKAGQSKLNEISKTYIETMDENGETTQKTVTVQIDGEDKYVTYFSPDGQYTELFIPINQSVSTEDMSNFNDKYNECAVIASEIKTETLPIAYTLTSGTFIESSTGEQFIKYAVITGIIIIAIISIIMIIKYKLSGLLATIIEIGFIGIHLLLIRAAGVSLTLAGLVMILFMALLNYMLIKVLINKEKAIYQLEAFGKFIIDMIPFIITIIVFVLSKSINLQSVGMVGVWAIFVLAYTLAASILLLKTENTKKNGVE